MSDKAGSDLDVFDGLAAKKSRPSAAPAPRAPAAPPSSATRQKTLLGLAAPVAPGAPGAAGPRPPGPPPPPPMTSRPPAPPPPPPPGGVAYEPPSKPSGGFPAPPPPPTPSSLGGPPPPPPPLAAPASAAPVQSLLAPPPPIAPPASSNPTRTFGSKPPVEEDDKTPVPAKAEGKPGVDIDWDDEDEATMVFDKSVEDTARSLLHSAPPPSRGTGTSSVPPSAPNPPPAAGAPPPSRLPTLSTRPGTSAPPPTLPRAPLPPPPKALQAPYLTPIPPQQAIFEPPVAPPSGGSRGLMIGAVVLLLAGAGAAAMFMLPKKGSMVVTVAGPGNKPIDTVEVYVDTVKKCAASPCRVVDLAAGTHLVKVTAAGYQPTADQAVKISNGDEAVQNIALTRASDGTGIRVAAEGRGIKLSVDGKEVGPLPQELKDLSPGEHLVHLDGGERYESFEKRITVEADQMQPIEPKLRVKKGLATIKLGENADDAKVLLVSGSERRPLPQLPITVDISVDKPYSIVATKKGFSEFEQRVAFEDGQAERTFVVNLTPSGSESTATAAPPVAAVPRSGAAPAPAPAAPAAPKPASGNGTVNLNSIPASNVLLDGRPMGQTPRMNVSVVPGSHTVVFVNADFGRKAKTITVEAGKAATVTVRFP